MNNNITTVSGIADVIREYLAFNSILLHKYKIMLTYTLSNENGKNQEEVLKNIKSVMPDIKVIALENRDTFPKNVWKDKELEGMRECLDDLEAIVAMDKKEKGYSLLVKQASILVLLYEQIRRQAVIKNIQGIRNLLALEEKIYNGREDALETLTDTIMDLAGKSHLDIAAIPKNQQRIYAFCDFLERNIMTYNCNSAEELEQALCELTRHPDSPEAKEFTETYGFPLKEDIIRNALHSEECYRGSILYRFFMDLEDLATTGEGKAIQLMLDEEGKLFTLPVEWLNNSMNKLEVKVGLR